MTFAESVNRAASAFAQRLELAGVKRMRRIDVAPREEGRSVAVEARDAEGELVAGAVYDHSGRRLLHDPEATFLAYGSRAV